MVCVGRPSGREGSSRACSSAVAWSSGNLAPVATRNQGNVSNRLQALAMQLDHIATQLQTVAEQTRTVARSEQPPSLDVQLRWLAVVTAQLERVRKLHNDEAVAAVSLGARVRDVAAAAKVATGTAHERWYAQATMPLPRSRARKTRSNNHK